MCDLSVRNYFKFFTLMGVYEKIIMITVVKGDISGFGGGDEMKR